nr:class I SAM-dependent DNA methyltransferase [Rhodothalassium salexigens]
MSDRDSTNTHEVISDLFRAMNTKHEDREAAGLRNWATKFPYVNGGLFADSVEVPTFTKMARSYLLHIGKLDWKKVNPDIFGSMIQAVADEKERGALGMHYTSVSNILKVLNPLFLDDLREQLEEAGDSPIKLINLRKRMAKIRVFDPACGSGNFLVIAYKEMRKIEAEINERRCEKDRRSDIPLTNFRGIELRDFPAEIARLALIIAEYQCDVLYRGQLEALKDVLPLNAMNWITCGNALRLDWLSICRPTGMVVKHHSDDLFHSPIDQAEIDFENEGGETYICGNPPYLGSSLQSPEQKADLEAIFQPYTKNWKILDYVSGWFMKASQFGLAANSAAAFVTTNSVCQGQQVPTLWPLIFSSGQEIFFAYTSFKWKNLASHNAGVTVVIVGIARNPSKVRRLFSLLDTEEFIQSDVDNINAYLVPAPNVYVNSVSKPLNGVTPMDYGSKPADGGGLVLSSDEKRSIEDNNTMRDFIVPYIGSTEFIDGKQRFCLWIESDRLEKAQSEPEIANRISIVQKFRQKSKKKPTKEAARNAHAFVEIRYGENSKTTVPYIIPIHTSENREYLPVGFLPVGTVVSNAAFALYDAPLWSIALIASRMHLNWIATVCGKIKTDYRYSNTLGWNTFPIPKLTEKNKADLTRCAEDILLAREAHFPATIADLYDPEEMPADLRAAHDRNDEVLERIYIGRRFKNDTERLEKLFELYTKMTSNDGANTKRKAVTQ